MKNLLLSALLLLSGCDLMSERLDEVGRVPSLSKINVYEEKFNPIHERVETNSRLSDLGYENGYQYHEEQSPKPRKSANSIWSKGGNSFFKAHKVGDILSVVVQVSDQARLDNRTQKARNSGSNIKAPSIFGVEKVIDSVLPDTSPSANLLNLKSNDSSAGSGKVDRRETVQTTIAVTVRRILPSGNLIVKGSQEIRVNFDVREVTIEGIVRPEDITMDNKVKLEQIAEARVSYGGRGQIFEYQQPPYGKQVLDIITPF